MANFFSVGCKILKLFNSILVRKELSNTYMFLSEVLKSNIGETITLITQKSINLNLVYFFWVNKTIIPFSVGPSPPLFRSNLKTPFVSKSFNRLCHSCNVFHPNMLILIKCILCPVRIYIQFLIAKFVRPYA